MLNKITGCESRTVPPLYVLRAVSLAKASHWSFSGKTETAADFSARHESEDLQGSFPRSCAFMGVK